MELKAPVDQQLVAALLRKLGYRAASGWVAASEFQNVNRHRFALQQAAADMSVVGAFCLMNRAGNSPPIPTPLVYVAQAASADRAKDIHRKVWSQGLVVRQVSIFG